MQINTAEHLARLEGFGAARQAVAWVPREIPPPAGTPECRFIRHIRPTSWCRNPARREPGTASSPGSTCTPGRQLAAARAHDGGGGHLMRP